MDSMKEFKCVLFLACFLKIGCLGSIVDIKIETNTSTEPFNHFWKSTGLCPPDPKEIIYKFLLNNDEKFNLLLIGAVPNRGIEIVRIHWLFDMIFSTGVDNSKYNFNYLDALFQLMVDHDLTPGFELMGFPISTNNNTVIPVKDHGFWKDLVSQIVRRYVDRFGANKVSQWKFETWNEPDLKNYNLLNFTLADYMQYINGCSDGLKSVFGQFNMSIRLGGPAGIFGAEKVHPLCWGLLDYCNKVGMDECPIKYVTFHSKGDGTARSVTDRSMTLLDSLSSKFPNLMEMPIGNDESDIIVTWSKSYEWLADTRYAAMVVQVIKDMYESVSRNRHRQIEVLSNDNGFLNYHPFYFTQRTLFARFQMNHTDPPHNQFIKKPVYAAMALLSLLGDRYLVVKEPEDPLLTIIATKTQEQEAQGRTSILLTYADNSTINANLSKTINVQLAQLKTGSRFVVYLLDNIRTNPYALWQQMKSPVFPDKSQRKQLRQVEEPYRLIGPTEVTSANLNVTLNVTVPSVALINICEKSTETLGTVTKLSVSNVTGNEVLLTWSDSGINTKCIKTYEVELARKCGNSSTNAEFKRINEQDTVFLSYHFASDSVTVEGDAACETTIGRYRVRAVDYWDTPGNYSRIISYP